MSLVLDLKSIIYLEEEDGGLLRSNKLVLHLNPSNQGVYITFKVAPMSSHFLMIMYKFCRQKFKNGFQFFSGFTH